jgi:hypothetical protein
MKLSPGGLTSQLCQTYCGQNLRPPRGGGSRKDQIEPRVSGQEAGTLETETLDSSLDAAPESTGREYGLCQMAKTG